MTPLLAPILSHLFNKSIDEQQYPDPLKVTKVIEPYKVRSNPANYRPVSLLPIIAKVFDTLLNNQMMNHLVKHDIISPTQYAFRPNSSTTLALQTIVNQIHKHASKHSPLMAIYVDLSKAYDTISHKRLIHKLRHNFNFTESTTAFFASYFQNRQQQTHTQHAKSDTQIITHGVPQGSTLSTTFFLLYINDIIKTTTKSTVYTYADDTTLVITADNIQDLQKLAQTELTNLIKYFHINNLVPNPTKTVYTSFFPKNQPIHISIGETIIQQDKSAKLLGIYIQSDRKYSQTINNILKKLQPVMHSFRHANKLLSTEVMREQYFTHVYPHFILNTAVWGTNDSSKTYIQPLIKAQKKIIRLIKNLSPRAHTKPIMTELHILSITNLYTLRVCVEMHPFIYPKKQLNRPEHNHRYTSVSEIHSHATRYASRKHKYVSDELEHLTRKYTNVWNSLPEDLRGIRAIGAFKKKTKTYLLEEQSNERM